MYVVEIKSRVAEIIRDRLATGIESDQKIGEDDDIIKAIRGDSLDKKELILMLGDEFNIKINKAEARECGTINQIAVLVEHKLRESGR